MEEKVSAVGRTAHHERRHGNGCGQQNYRRTCQFFRAWIQRWRDGLSRVQERQSMEIGLMITERERAFVPANPLLRATPGPGR
jgi:hypothetical protein